MKGRNNKMKKKTAKRLKLIAISATAILTGAALLYVNHLLVDFRYAGYIGMEYPASEIITNGRIFVARATELLFGIVGGALVFNGVGFLFSNIKH